jgi:hypothetical protein
MPVVLYLIDSATMHRQCSASRFFYHFGEFNRLIHVGL